MGSNRPSSNWLRGCAGGYIIDFRGAGFDVAERMGLLPELQRRGYVVDRVRVVDQDGRRIAGFPASAFLRATHGRYLSLPRGDLAATIFNSLRGGVETIFGDSIESLQQTDKHVRVTFDIVIGADGLHSRVRARKVLHDAGFARRMIGERFAGCGWEWPRINVARNWTGRPTSISIASARFG